MYPCGMFGDYRDGIDARFGARQEWSVKKARLFQETDRMNPRARWVALFVCLVWFMLPGLVLCQAPPATAYLLKVSGGQTFGDTGLDNKTKPVPVDPQDLSKGLKVA